MGAAAVEARLGRMMSLAKPATAEHREVDDGFIDPQRGTVAPAEAESVVAAESRGGVHGFACLGGFRKKARGSLGIQRLAGHAFFAH